MHTIRFHSEHLEIGPISSVPNQKVQKMQSGLHKQKRPDASRTIVSKRLKKIPAFDIKYVQAELTALANTLEELKSLRHKSGGGAKMVRGESIDE
jgi:hypothetical protein